MDPCRAAGQAAGLACFRGLQAPNWLSPTDQLVSRATPYSQRWVHACSAAAWTPTLKRSRWRPRQAAGRTCTAFLGCWAAKRASSRANRCPSLRGVWPPLRRDLSCHAESHAESAETRIRPGTAQLPPRVLPPSALHPSLHASCPALTSWPRSRWPCCVHPTRRQTCRCAKPAHGCSHVARSPVRRTCVPVAAERLAARPQHSLRRCQAAQRSAICGWRCAVPSTTADQSLAPLGPRVPSLLGSTRRQRAARRARSASRRPRPPLPL